MFSGGIERKYGNENGLISCHIRMFMFLGGCIPSLPLLSIMYVKSTPPKG